MYWSPLNPRILTEVVASISPLFLLTKVPVIYLRASSRVSMSRNAIFLSVMTVTSPGASSIFFSVLVAVTTMVSRL